MNKEEKAYLQNWSLKYQHDLVENIFPFWLKNGLDKKNGGFYTCLDRDGSLMDATKSVWFQGRAAYVFANAYNIIEKNSLWLEASKSAIDFIERYCFDTDGRMYFEMSENGVPLRKRRYLFSECFAAIAMSEYSIASGDKSYAEKALNLFKFIVKTKNTPGALTPKYTEHFETRGHSICMILINTASRIREAINDEILTLQIQESIIEIRDFFMKPEFKAVLEMVGPNGEFIDTCIGRTINPGHCIETAWFILEEAKYKNWDTELVSMATTILDWSWEWGWDKQYGGIINFRDCKNLPSQDYAHDMKFWWPQTEAVIATLHAFEATGNSKYLNMHQQINEYMYKYFPDNEHGEWFGYLHRDGSVSQSAKGNLFKGPFHIPRMLIKSKALCDVIVNGEKYNHLVNRNVNQLT